jgi:hypothetical protein
MQSVKFFVPLCLLCASLLLNCGKNAVSPEQAMVTEMQTKVHDISSEVAMIRGLDFIRPVRAGVVSKKQFAASTSQNVRRSMSAAEEEGLSKEFAQMCFLAESDTPLGTVMSDFYSSFPAAFYTMGTDSLTIIEQSYDSDEELDFMIAHELTHALQDQHLNMKPMVFPGYSSYNSDASVAQSALMEGDAMFTGIAYAAKSQLSISMDAAFDSAASVSNIDRQDMLSGRYSPENPVFMDIRATVPYLFGDAFVAKAYHDGGGWSGVNGLYSISSTPRSSAEIARMAPVTAMYFDFYAIQKLLASGSGAIDYADDDNAGFALMLGMFYRDLDTARAGRALEWRGDRYTFVKRSGQPYGTLVWALSFADKEAAAYMFGKFAGKIMNRRLAGKLAKVDSTSDSLGRGSTYTFTSASAATTLRRVDEQIWWLENTDTLTPRIIASLERQRTAPALAKKTQATALPVTLAPSEKRKAIDGLLRHMLRY